MFCPSKNIYTVNRSGATLCAEPTSRPPAPPPLGLLQTAPWRLSHHHSQPPPTPPSLWVLCNGLRDEHAKLAWPEGVQVQHAIKPALEHRARLSPPQESLGGWRPPSLSPPQQQRWLALPQPPSLAGGKWRIQGGMWGGKGGVARCQRRGGRREGAGIAEGTLWGARRWRQVGPLRGRREQPWP